MTTETKTDSKKVKIKLIRAIGLPVKDKQGNVINYDIKQPGEVLTVTEEQAKMYCDKKYKIGFNDWGETSKPNYELSRAVRV